MPNSYKYIDIGKPEYPLEDGYFFADFDAGEVFVKAISLLAPSLLKVDVVSVRKGSKHRAEALLKCSFNGSSSSEHCFYVYVCPIEAGGRSLELEQRVQFRPGNQWSPPLSSLKIASAFAEYADKSLEEKECYCVGIYKPYSHPETDDVVFVGISPLTIAPYEEINYSPGSIQVDIRSIREAYINGVSIQIKDSRKRVVCFKPQYLFWYMLNRDELHLGDLSKANEIVEEVVKSRSYSPTSIEAGESPLQVVYYGAPGTGKSHKISHNVIPPGAKTYRVTFYADYYYSDFVGGPRPSEGVDGIEYKFKPGPFAEALKDSFTEPTYLIIEEINRGNAAAIFGDIFQLLDRKGGTSVYSTTNKELYGYLIGQGVTGLEENKVILPSNLNILCTMNTADQNVFVLDTAFKRRFRMEYVPIDFNAFFVEGKPDKGFKSECEGYGNVEIFENDEYEKNLEIVMTTDLYKSVKEIVGEPKRDWRTFAAYVNAKIDSINAAEQKISEDKKLGPFFVGIDELKSRQAFTDKVIYYLKQDVFKYEDSILVDSYEVLYDAFVTKKIDLFDIFQNAR